MEQKISKQSATLIKNLLYEECAFVQDQGLKDEMNKTLNAINEFNQLLDREYVGL